MLRRDPNSQHLVLFPLASVATMGSELLPIVTGAASRRLAGCALADSQRFGGSQERETRIYLPLRSAGVNILPHH